MGILPGDDDVVPAQSERTRHYADRIAGIFKNRPLLDMRFEVGRKRFARCSIARVAYSPQLVADRLAVDIFLREGVLEGECACKYTLPHHHRREARSLFVCPDRNFKRMLGLDAPVVHRAHHFERRENAVVAVEFSASGLGVDMAA